MDDVPDRFFRAARQHNTSCSDKKIKHLKMTSFKSSENIQKKEGGPDRSFLYVKRIERNAKQL